MSRNPTNADDALLLYRCFGGHAYFSPYRRCPLCGLDLVEQLSEPEGVIVSQTVVRVNPTGRPFRLGLAEVSAGARTLCLLADDVSGEHLAPVRLVRRGDLYHAKRRRT